MFQKSKIKALFVLENYFATWSKLTLQMLLMIFWLNIYFNFYPVMFNYISVHPSTEILSFSVFIAYSALWTFFINQSLQHPVCSCHLVLHSSNLLLSSWHWYPELHCLFKSSITPYTVTCWSWTFSLKFNMLIFTGHKAKQCLMYCW